METKVCLECGIEKPIHSFGTSLNVQVQKSGRQVVRRKNICHACFSNRQRARIKMDMLSAFDFKCSCCGETHPDFLSLEHISGVGKTSGKRASNKEKLFAKKHGWNKEHFSVLCYNCNCAKQYFGRCPHEVNETTELGLERLRKKGEPRRYYVHERWVKKRMVDAAIAEAEKQV